MNYKRREKITHHLHIAILALCGVMIGVTVLQNANTHAETLQGYNILPEEKTHQIETIVDTPKDEHIGGIRQYDEISYIVIHHTATRDDLTASEMKLSMKRTYLDNRGGSVIPTHYIIDKWGNLERVNPINKIVGATLDGEANIQGVHIELVGDFNKNEPTRDQYNTLNSLIEKIENEVGGRLEFKGHGDFQAKNCPGKNFDFNRLRHAKEIKIGDVLFFNEITAYYTPLETDTIFSHGDYERSRKVNGDFVNAMGWDYKEDHKYTHGACGSRRPFGTILEIEGWGEITCVDRGSAIDNNDIDIRYGIGENALRNIQGGVVHPQSGKVKVLYLPN